jgi:GAF domain-containing protein
METSFKHFLDEIDALMKPDKERDHVLSEVCRLLKDKVYHYDWVGFYIADKQSQALVLGPFAGKSTGHITIPFGKGVCGQVALDKKTKIVQDVSKEDNYLSCSIDVQSEIVSPVLKNDIFVAELDIDSHSRAPFTEKDQQFLESICKKISVLF